MATLRQDRTHTAPPELPAGQETLTFSNIPPDSTVTGARLSILENNPGSSARAVRLPQSGNRGPQTADIAWVLAPPPPPPVTIPPQPPPKAIVRYRVEVDFQSNPSGGPAGPDNNLRLNPDMNMPVSLPPGKTFQFFFAFNGHWENALIIYRDGLKLVERGNYSRSSEPWSYTNTDRSTANLVITGWHKNSPPDGSKPWMQSPCRKGLWAHPLYSVGFEDGADNNFTDAVVYFMMK